MPALCVAWTPVTAPTFHGKEGVVGSSPSDGSSFCQHVVWAGPLGYRDPSLYTNSGRSSSTREARAVIHRAARRWTVVAPSGIGSSGGRGSSGLPSSTVHLAWHTEDAAFRMLGRRHHMDTSAEPCGCTSRSTLSGLPCKIGIFGNAREGSSSLSRRQRALLGDERHAPRCARISGHNGDTCGLLQAAFYLLIE